MKEHFPFDITEAMTKSKISRLDNVNNFCPHILDLEEQFHCAIAIITSKMVQCIQENLIRRANMYIQIESASNISFKTFN